MTTIREREQVKRLNRQDIVGGNQHDFYWDHLGHKIKSLQVVVNSTEVDPTTSDPLPVSGTQLVCLTCKETRGKDIRSAVEMSPVVTG